MSHSNKYINYLKSKLWKERRYAALERAKFRCQFKKCGEKRYLSVHHKNYDRLGNEDPGDLVVLCSGHHWYADQVRKHPQTKEFQTEKKLILCSLGQKIVRKIAAPLKFKSDHGYLNKKTKIKLKAAKLELEQHVHFCHECVYH